MIEKGKRRKESNFRLFTRLMLPIHVIIRIIVKIFAEYSGIKAIPTGALRVLGFVIAVLIVQFENRSYIIFSLIQSVILRQTLFE